METVLNLYNFDSLNADGARYVLTSPRSLEACSRMKVKPVELLPKSLEDFKNENSGKSIDFLQILCDDNEENRLSLLQRCRKERERIIMEQKIGRNDRKQQVKPNKKKSNNVSDQEKSSKTALDRKQLDKRSSNWEKQLTTKSVFDPRCKPVIMTSEPSRTTTPDKTQDGDGLSLSPVFPRSGCSNKMFVNKRDGLRSKSVEVVNRNSKLRPSNTSLRTSSVFGDNSPLPSGYTTPQIQRDKKLIEVMKQRRKREELDGKMRYEKVISWSLEKNKQDQAKKKEAIKRHKELAQSQVEWERRLRNEELRKVAKTKELEIERIREQELTESAIKSNKEKQDKLRLHHIEVRKKAANERKHLQEKALDAFNHDVMAFQQAVEEEINNKQHKASQMKLENEMKELNKVKLMNKKQKERLMEIRRELKKKEEEKEEMRREAIEEKIQRATENYSKKVLTRDLNIKNQSRQIDAKIKQTKDLARQMDKENETYLQSVVDHTNEKIRKAGDVALKNTENKSIRAKIIRKSSEEGWKKKQHEIQEKDQLHVQKIKDNLEQRESRLQRHLQLREAAFEFSRVQAKINEAEREIVKRNTSNFNEMAQKAKLTASIGRGPRSSFVNYSTVKLG